jgi:uncharacterized FlaG/YvyC family protein
MGENVIGPLEGVPEPQPAAAVHPVQTDERAFRHAVLAAVRDLNQAGYAGEGREVTYSIDPGSRKPVVRVVESETKEVITQWPAEYALAIAAESSQTRDSG